jgi:hypothetical protein
MDLVFKTMDLQVLLLVPLMVITILSVKKNWQSLFDNNLTAADRSELKRVAFILLEPIVVFFHELGHALTTIFFGGKIVEFHYAILNGYVVPSGIFTHMQDFWITLNGNLVGIGIGYLCLIAALFVEAPAVVATLVYLGLFSVGGTVIVYAFMSIFGLYGDWIQIYTAPLPLAVSIVGVCHAAMIASLIYMVKSRKTRMWFSRKTDPAWAKTLDVAEETAKSDPSVRNLQNLAITYHDASLDDFAIDILNKCVELDATAPSTRMLFGALNFDRGKYKEAADDFQAVLQNDRADDFLKSKAFMDLGYTSMARGRVARENPKKSNEEALAFFDKAINVAPSLGDPRVQRATLLNSLGRFSEAEKTLTFDGQLEWFDSSRAGQIEELLKAAAEGQMSAK